MSFFGSKRARASQTLEEQAEEFIRRHHAEEPEESGRLGKRLRHVRAEIRRTGSYTHTEEELVFGARLAWRNSSRCIGRLYWRGLRVRDRRHVASAADVARESFEHLAQATLDGRIRPLVTVFAPDGPDGPGPRIWNDQLIRYAGYRGEDGRVTGDPRNVRLTETARAVGWPGGPGTRFDVLPLLVEAGGEVRCFDVPEDVVQEIPLSHPDFPWFAELDLRWYTVPAVSDMTLEIGGISYGAAPFSGWYMGTEIGARNLGDTGRYDQLPAVATRLGLDTTSEATLWRDRALVELNVAVLHSFRSQGVTITDHHTESRRFLAHLAKEEAAGRTCPADWSWIVPPISGSATPVFHRYYDEADLRPNFLRRPCPYDVQGLVPRQRKQDRK